jgi:hypothetical protein
VYILTYLLTFIMKDTSLITSILWETESDSAMDNTIKMPLAIKLIDSIMVLLFKPGYTVVVTEK